MSHQIAGLASAQRSHRGHVPGLWLLTAAMEGNCSATTETRGPAAVGDWPALREIL
jgi:hypothetical protein